MEYNVKITKGLESNPDAALIRKSVFIYEQGFENEFDDIDKTAVHCVLYLGGYPVGTGRVFEENGSAHIGRVAVQKNYRGKGNGTKIINSLESYAKEQGFKECALSAQTRAKGFYEKLGYEQQGEEYFEEYCRHILMVKKL